MGKLRDGAAGVAGFLRAALPYGVAVRLWREKEDNSAEAPRREFLP
ncbi:hypothetical protein [Thermus sp.]|nr:hypothetical protein [Thermus sp.]MCS6867289.1 hypothetical protein [Thermus sp.]MDW8358949.1 hypothetical protein [Thermus sp.]